MRRKSIGQRMPHNTIRLDSKSELTYAQRYHHCDGIEYQTYAMAADRTLVHAGVSRHTSMDETVAWQIQRLWERWRNEYDNLPENIKRNYPAKNCPRVT